VDLVAAAQDPLGSGVGGPWRSFGCKLPWSKKLPKTIREQFSFGVKVDDSGHLSVDGDYLDGLASLKLKDWKGILKHNPDAVEADICVYDPKIPELPLKPWDPEL
jgi:hypothetical protein